MPVILDSKDVALIDKDFASESQVWELLKEGAKDITESDFVGVNEVRVNVMKGFTKADYKRNKDNERKNISVQKETLKLTQEDWMGYDLDKLDQEENAAYQVANVISEHRRLISVPTKDARAVKVILDAAFAEKDSNLDPEGKYVGKTVQETITKENALESYDKAEAYMTDADIVGPFVMFVSSDYYYNLKNAQGVTKSFTTNEVKINGINRKVESLDDGDVYIKKVAKSRLQQLTDKTVNYILVPLTVASPIEKVNAIDLVPASQDRSGYRDTIKGLDYYDLIVLLKARPAIYVSYKAEAPGV